MSDVLDDKLLSNLELIASTLSEWRRSSFADARLVNSSFEVKVLAHFYRTDLSGYHKILDVDYSRVALWFACSDVGFYVVPGTGIGDRLGIFVPAERGLTFTIRDFPGLVAMDWYFGTKTFAGGFLYTIEVLDRRRR